MGYKDMLAQHAEQCVKRHLLIVVGRAVSS